MVKTLFDLGFVPMMRRMRNAAPKNMMMWSKAAAPTRSIPDKIKQMKATNEESIMFIKESKCEPSTKFQEGLLEEFEEAKGVGLPIC